MRFSLNEQNSASRRSTKVEDVICNVSSPLSTENSLSSSQFEHQPISEHSSGLPNSNFHPTKPNQKLATSGIKLSSKKWKASQWLYRFIRRTGHQVAENKINSEFGTANENTPVQALHNPFALSRLSSQELKLETSHQHRNSNSFAAILPDDQHVISKTEGGNTLPYTTQILKTQLPAPDELLVSKNAQPASEAGPAKQQLIRFNDDLPTSVMMAAVSTEDQELFAKTKSGRTMPSSTHMLKAHVSAPEELLVPKRTSPSSETGAVHRWPYNMVKRSLRFADDLPTYLSGKSIRPFDLTSRARSLSLPTDKTFSFLQSQSRRKRKSDSPFTGYRLPTTPGSRLPPIVTNSVGINPHQTSNTIDLSTVAHTYFRETNHLDPLANLATTADKYPSPPSTNYSSAHHRLQPRSNSKPASSQDESIKPKSHHFKPSAITRLLLDRFAKRAFTNRPSKGAGRASPFSVKFGVFC